MKLLSHVEFHIRKGKLFYLERPVTTDRVNAKQGLTLVNDQKRVVLTEGVYTLKQLKDAIL